jgi:hypothetical protein
MNSQPESPIKKLNPHEKWFRFNSLPFEIQECIIKLLCIARGDGLDPIIARGKLDRLYAMTDTEIIDNFNYQKNNSNPPNNLKLRSHY